MIKQTVESTDRLQGLDFGNDKSPAHLGSFRAVVVAHEGPPATLDWSIRWKLTEPLRIKKPEDRSSDLFAGDETGFHVEISENDKKRFVVKRIVYSFAGREFQMARKSDGKHADELSVLKADGFHFKRAVGRAWDLPAPVKGHGFPNEGNARFSERQFPRRSPIGIRATLHGNKVPRPFARISEKAVPLVWGGASGHGTTGRASS